MRKFNVIISSKNDASYGLMVAEALKIKFYLVALKTLAADPLNKTFDPSIAIMVLKQCKEDW